MTGTFGVVSERIDAPSESLTHDDRLSSAAMFNPDLAALKWQSAKELLLVDLLSGNAPIGRLPARPKLTRDLLWIPISDADERVVGPLYQVGFRSSGPLLRVRAARAIRFLPGLHVRVAGTLARVLGTVGAADASRLKWLERRLRGVPASEAPLLPEVEQTGRDRPTEGLSPAARSVCATIERDPIGAHHVIALEKKGALDLVRLLESRGRLKVMASGQIVATTHMTRLAEELRGAEGRFNSRDVADRFGTSIGLAGLILSELTASGVVDRLAGGFYKVKTDEPD